MNKLVDQFMDRLLEDGESPLRLWREQRGMSLFALAEAVGIKPSELAEYEGGMWKPSEDLTVRLASALNVKPVELDNPQDDSFDVGTGDEFDDLASDWNA